MCEETVASVPASNQDLLCLIDFSDVPTSVKIQQTNDVQSVKPISKVSISSNPTTQSVLHNTLLQRTDFDNVNSKTTPGQNSLPSSRKKYRSSRIKNRPNQTLEQHSVSHSSTPEKVDTEMDPYTQWYHMMEQYYKQFYPNRSFVIPSAARKPNQSSGFGPSEFLSSQQWGHKPAQCVPPPAVATGSQVDWSQMVPNATGAPSQPLSQTPFDYAAYYYQYYLGASQMWAGDSQISGRQTPKIFIEPHIRANLLTPGLIIQVLPTRPQDNESAHVEILDLSQLVTDVVAEANNRIAELSVLSVCHMDRTNFPGAIDSGRENSITTGGFSINQDDSTDAHSSLLQSADDLQSSTDDDAEMKECSAIISAWDRCDHAHYPGPLSRVSTLKSDVLAFLRGKLEEIQDRMPLDWDSAGLLISYLELLVKNNGVAHPGDVVNLILADQPPRNYDCSNSRATYLCSTKQNLRLFSDSYFHHGRSSDSISSMPPSQPESGRQSPTKELMTHSVSSNYFQHSGAASLSGAPSVSNQFRKATFTTIASPEELETASLNRFRELIIYGHPIKALEHACQQRLWGHAFTLAHRMGPVMLDKVMDRFLGKAVNPADPLLTLYQLTAGELPRYVDQLAYASVVDNGDWRPHLAMLLSAPENHLELARQAITRLGDSLYSRHLIYAAHFCYLLVHSATLSGDSRDNSRSLRKFPAHIWLLGAARPESSEVPDADVETADWDDVFGHLRLTERGPTEAIQLTEIYEFTQALACRDQHYFLPQFLPFKFMYCMKLIDAGLIEKAFRYLEVLSYSLAIIFQTLEGQSNSSSDLISLFTLVSVCIQFADRLQQHPEVESFESVLSGSGSSFGRFSFGFSAISDATPHLKWLDQLREVYSRLCSELGLPTNQEPFVKPIALSDAEFSHPLQVKTSPSPTTPIPFSNPPSAVRSHPQPIETQHPIKQEYHPQGQITDQLPHGGRISSRTSRGPSQSSDSGHPNIVPNELQHSMTSTNQHSAAPHQPYMPFAPVFEVNSPEASIPLQVTGQHHESIPASYDYFANFGASHTAPRSRTISNDSHGSRSEHSPPFKQNSGRVSSGPYNPRSRNPSSSTTVGESRFAINNSVFPTNSGPESLPIDKEPDVMPSIKEDAGDITISTMRDGAKDGLFSRLLGRFKRTGEKGVHLPDDSKPSLIWDEKTERWIDTENPEPEQEPPPPPMLPMVNHSGLPSISSASPSSLAEPVPVPMAAPGAGFGVRSPHGRPRYVNVLANQTSGSAAQKVGVTKLQPPLPSLLS